MEHIRLYEIRLTLDEDSLRANISHKVYRETPKYYIKQMNSSMFEDDKLVKTPNIVDSRVRLRKDSLGKITKRNARKRLTLECLCFPEEIEQKKQEMLETLKEETEENLSVWTKMKANLNERYAPLKRMDVLSFYKDSKYYAENELI